MSSTNRGSERNKADYYYTPMGTIQEFWRFFCKIENKTIDNFSIILDPCAGGDLNKPCAYPEAFKLFTSDISKFTTIDIRSDSQAFYKLDFVTMTINFINKFSLIISNPPFFLFESFVKKALSMLSDDGYLIFLCRENIRGGQKRKSEFWDLYPAKWFVTHSKRPFPDSVEYCHFVWQNNYKGETKAYII